jgi:hypothetical protein
MSRASNKQTQEQSRLRNEHIEGEFRPDSSTLERHSSAGRYLLLIIVLAPFVLYMGFSRWDEIRQLMLPANDKPPLMEQTYTKERERTPPMGVVDDVMNGQIERSAMNAELGEPLPVPAAELILPTLERSDTFFRDQWALLGGGPMMTQWASADQIVRRSMTVIDNLSRGKVVNALLRTFAPSVPFMVLPQSSLATEESVETYRLDPSGYERFTPFVTMINGLDNSQLIDFYLKLRPLFQQAYLELGYPSGHVDDVVLKAMRVIQAVSLPDGDIRLLRPKVLYQFADPALESLSSLEKLFIRMGAENTKIVQQKVSVLEQSLRGQLDAR